MKTIILLVSASIAASVGCHRVAAHRVQWQWKTGRADACRTSQSPYSRQRRCRRVAVFCSHGSGTCCRELESHCEGRDFMFRSPPPLPASSYRLHVQRRRHSVSLPRAKTRQAAWPHANYGLTGFSYLHARVIPQGPNLTLLPQINNPHIKQNSQQESLRKPS